MTTSVASGSKRRRSSIWTELRSWIDAFYPSVFEPAVGPRRTRELKNGAFDYEAPSTSAVECHREGNPRFRAKSARLAPRNPRSARLAFRRYCTAIGHRGRHKEASPSLMPQIVQSNSRGTPLRLLLFATVRCAPAKCGTKREKSQSPRRRIAKMKRNEIKRLREAVSMTREAYGKNGR